jgi:DNA-binding NarL/FixJ family response regulator
MKRPGPIWVDERNPIYRRGVLTCLKDEGYTIAGESALLQPAPDLSATSVLIFDFDAAGTAQLDALARHRELVLVALVREASAERVRAIVRAGLSAVLTLRGLTPARLQACMSSLADGSAPRTLPAIERVPGRAEPAEKKGLTQREFEVLCLLAGGDTTRDIAKRLSYSERTIKNIVRDLLAKLNGRTRAHAVALAARQGVI